MGKLSRSKGQRGERFIAAALTALGEGEYKRNLTECREGNQGDVSRSSQPGSFLAQVKWYKKNVPINRAMLEAKMAAIGTEIPIACTKEDGQPWMVTLLLEDFSQLARAWIKLQKGGLSDV